LLRVTADETGSSAVDQIIEHHVKELRDKEETVLPAERTALINVHDRLQQRKTRRMRREFYASVKDDVIADLVLKLLDEEIEDEENAKLA
jgi:DNA recombination-dependent growth factor C